MFNRMKGVDAEHVLAEQHGQRKLPLRCFLAILLRTCRLANESTLTRKCDNLVICKPVESKMRVNTYVLNPFF
jgi:hypothetical protein